MKVYPEFDLWTDRSQSVSAFVTESTAYLDTLSIRTKTRFPNLQWFEDAGTSYAEECYVENRSADVWDTFLITAEKGKRTKFQDAVKIPKTDGPKYLLEEGFYNAYTFQQPSLRTVIILKNWLRRKEFRYTRRDFALDHVTKFPVDAEILGDFLKRYSVRNRTVRYSERIEQGTRYKESGNMTYTYYADKGSKLYEHKPPCSHFEVRMFGDKKVKVKENDRFGELIDMDCRSFFEKHLQLRRLKNGFILGKKLKDGTVAGTKNLTAEKKRNFKRDTVKLIKQSAKEDGFVSMQRLKEFTRSWSDVSGYENVRNILDCFVEIPNSRFLPGRDLTFKS